jgi:ribosomal protein S19
MKKTFSIFRKKSFKILFCAPIIWKKIFFFKKSPVFKASEKFFYNRSSIIPKIYQKCNIYIYNGKIWNTRFVNRWMVGFKLGEFTWNKKPAIYKAKQLRKKKKKK